MESVIYEIEDRVAYVTITVLRRITPVTKRRTTVCS